MRMRGGAGPNLLLAGDHPLLDALVLAALRRWRVRTLRELEAGTGRTRPPMHVSLYGPGAEARVARLRARWRPEPEVLVLEARDSPPPGDPPGDGELWLRRPGRADHAIVACGSELDGIALTLTVARALGGQARITRVTTQRESALDTHLEQRTAASDQLASTEVKSVAELGARPERMQRLSDVERLRRRWPRPAAATRRRPGSAPVPPWPVPSSRSCLIRVGAGARPSGRCCRPCCRARHPGCRSARSCGPGCG